MRGKGREPKKQHFRILIKTKVELNNAKSR